MKTKRRNQSDRSLNTHQRWSFLSRDDFTCVFCGDKPGNDRLHVDHIIPYSLGGSDHESNIVTACDKCNLGKSDRVAVPKSMHTGEKDADGWTIWKRWGKWYVAFSESGKRTHEGAPIAACGPHEYWIAGGRVHEMDWHDHMANKIDCLRDLEQWKQFCEAFKFLSALFDPKT